MTPTPRIDGLSDALDYLGEKLATEPLVISIDEFLYLVEENDSPPSYIQSFVDELLEDTNSMLVLCGSSVSKMESEVLGHESPLYGRRTGQIDLQPFSFQEARDVMTYQLEDAIRSFAVTGGTPMYLTLFDYEQPLRKKSSNICSLLQPCYTTNRSSCCGQSYGTRLAT